MIIIGLFFIIIDLLIGVNVYNGYKNGVLRSRRGFVLRKEDSPKLFWFGMIAYSIVFVFFTLLVVNLFVTSI